MKKIRNTQLIIGVSSIAIVILILLQVKWLTDSHKLIEEQFDQKVTLAVRESISNIGQKQEGSTPGCLPAPESNVSLENISAELSQTLNCYKVPKDFNLSIINKDSFSEAALPPYCCSLEPLVEDDNQLLSISFPGKPKNNFKNLGFMLATSLIILVFILLVFLLSNYALIRQKRISQMNVDFFNNMAHEFRTPLTNISLATNLFKKRNGGFIEDKHLAVIQKENEKLKDQIERVLQMTQLESGESRLQIETVNLENLLKSVIQDMELVIQNAGATIRIEANSTFTSIQGDRLHLANAMRNLIENGIKYAKNSPEILIKIDSMEDGVLLLFQDNGIGISQKQLPYIFNKFHRVGTGNLHPQKGFGLGLSYVKMVAELHNGFVKAISELNKGSRFDLFLPKTPV